MSTHPSSAGHRAETTASTERIGMIWAEAAGGVIGATLAWMIGQLVLFTRARIPVFEVDAR